MHQHAGGPRPSPAGLQYDSDHRRSLSGPSTIHHPKEYHSQHASHSHHPPLHHGLPTHYRPSSHHYQVLIDPGQMTAHSGPRHVGHLTPTQYGAGSSPHSVVAPAPPPPPLYLSMGAAPQSSLTSGIRRSRTDELDISIPGMAELEQNEMQLMKQSQLSAGYGQAATGQHYNHHHHRMPDTGPPARMMRWDSQGGGGGGAPSVVAQAGMPPSAPRPRRNFAAEEDALLVDLKENKSLTWKQISNFFPERSEGTLRVRYNTKLKATTEWTEDNDQKLRMALQDYEREKWRVVASKVGTGFTPAACQERAIQLEGGTATHMD